MEITDSFNWIFKHWVVQIFIFFIDQVACLKISKPVIAFLFLFFAFTVIMLCEEAFQVHKESFRATSYSIQCNRCVDFASPKFIKTLR